MGKNRYLLFSSDLYYPSGGWADFITSFETIEEADIFISKAKFNLSNSWWELVDTEVLNVIKKGEE